MRGTASSYKESRHFWGGERAGTLSLSFLSGNGRKFQSLSQPPVASFIMAYRKTGKKKRERERKNLSKLYKVRDCERKKKRSGREGYRMALPFRLRVYLSVLLRFCFGFQESVSQQTPVRGSGGR